MSRHVFHEIYLHINWHAKNNHPLLAAKLEPLVHDFVRQRCRQTKGVYLHGYASAFGGQHRTLGMHQRLDRRTQGGMFL